ncbi:MAG: poly[(R)-3-hydroxyalkanoate] polymerase subunit PhaC [Actinomycetota bacterium]|nr:poly[(R)-3-hydroxyalkanoate] polymerase subunit PhaC [Actinomycetota bacterium]
MSADPVSFGLALAELGAEIARNPEKALDAWADFSADLAAAASDTVDKAVRPMSVAADDEGPPRLAPGPKDRRFADPSWVENPWFFGQRQAYLAWSKFMHNLGGAADLDERTSQKAAFAVGMIVDALAPTNFAASNPAAIRKAFETDGESLRRGLDNFLDDLAANGGKPRQVDASSFELGVNLAATPGQVVFRNDLMELIQYSPRTETVHDVPLILCPPWINKYYVMDLAPGRSFAEWAVDHGHTTFALSWRNPDADHSMSQTTLDDYLLQGLATAVDVVRQICGVPQVNVAGLCVGGTLAVMLLAWQAQTEAATADDGGGLPPVRSLTLLNTLVDFSQPGALAAFTDLDAIERLEQGMAERGYLDGAEMAGTFDALRPNDLIWNYVAGNWLMGQTPPAFDILAWNADATRIPAATHSAYLRSFYLENRLARGQMTIGGRRLSLDDIESDVYVLAASEDHITPWKSSYATVGLLPSPIRFVLSSAGHIAGIVNPPGPKRVHWTNDDLPLDPDAWRAGAVENPGTWWDDWTAWIQDRAGEHRQPPPTGSDTHPAIGIAPGTYVGG